jgi:hypothetical protein
VPLRRPDIRAAEQNLIAANACIGVARAQYFPTISLMGLFGYASEQPDDLLESSANVWNIGGSALGPIFTGGAISGQVRASEAVQTAFREVDDALVNVQKSREQLVAEGRRVAALAEYARLAELRDDDGYASYIEVLDAQRLLFDAELQYVAVQGDVYASLVGTYKAMGGGWVIEAQRDPVGANLDRIQIIKGWLDAEGDPQERIYDVAVSDGRKIAADGRCMTPVGDTVDLSIPSWTNTIGASELGTVWTDPDFDPKLRAFYYARVIEIPTPRRTAYDRVKFGLDLPKSIPLKTRERAYTSPIWYTPKSYDGIAKRNCSTGTASYVACGTFPVTTGMTGSGRESLFSD